MYSYYSKLYVSPSVPSCTCAGYKFGFKKKLHTVIRVRAAGLIQSDIAATRSGKWVGELNLRFGDLDGLASRDISTRALTRRFGVNLVEQLGYRNAP